MRDEWSSRGNGRGGSFGRGGQGAGRPGQNAGTGDRGGSGFGRAQDSGARWSDELDAIFERAPKAATLPKNEDEKNFFEERSEVKPATLACPNCHHTADYALNWLVRRKRDHPQAYADDATRARFEKASSYMVRRDDTVVCQNARCRKRFEIAGVQSVAFLEATSTAALEDRAARVRAAFAGRRAE